ncbi:type II toxin-antitoxin system RatA family toxin [Patulibacter defluvii]|uniref:type II toxin-antitoxin system RatA family toxin n=1 Tax=Patulibacter defluvii TaxID=3095358 RepID=UPI002A757899|nr:SRPBCC family protein [Patulibacter sp. DM4]
MGRLKGTASAELDAPIARVWDVIADIATIGEWQGTMDGVRVLDRDPDGRALTARFEIDAKVRVLKATIRFRHEQPTRLSWRQESGDLASMDGSWTLEDLGGDRTRATYALDIDPGFGLGMFVRGEVEQKLRERLVTRRPEELRARLAATA